MRKQQKKNLVEKQTAKQNHLEIQHEWQQQQKITYGVSIWMSLLLEMLLMKTGLFVAIFLYKALFSVFPIRTLFDIKTHTLFPGSTKGNCHNEKAKCHQSFIFSHGKSLCFSYWSRKVIAERNINKTMKKRFGGFKEKLHKGDSHLHYF